ncbi:MAG: tRNA 2-thiouridine(34) synthase MnmA [Candidatus Pacearchaeota archaeon]
MKPKKVLIALSGGVDSAVAAYLLKKKGYEVVGLFMRTFRDEKIQSLNPCKNPGGKTDEKFARLIAKMLRIKLIIIDAKKQYKDKVITSMIKDYAKGLTPNPDITCNTLIKFPILLNEAEKLKADYIATGHYARIKKTKSGYTLLAGKDKTKDQSYFLYQLTQKELSRLIFPVGTLKKENVRKIAKSNNFPNWDKPGTTGVCYLGNTQNIKSFLENKIKHKKGKILSPEGEFLGYHPGTSYFTIGQKIQEHLGMTINKPRSFAQKKYYIAEKRKGNILIAAPENHPSLKKREIKIKNFHLIAPKGTIPKSGLKARIRHLGDLHKGNLSKKYGDFIFRFNKPVAGIAEGQHIVLYKNNEVIGGGEMSNFK